MTRALRRTLRDAHVAWLLTLATAIAAGLLRCTTPVLVLSVLFAGCSIQPSHAPASPMPHQEATRALRRGTVIQVYISEPALSPRPVTEPPLDPIVEVFVGKLDSTGSDSLTFLASYQDERITVPLAMIVRLDTAAGHRSRLLWSILGAPLGMGIGALLCAATGGAAFDCGFLGTIWGPIIGGAAAGQQWRRVPAFNVAAIPSAGAALETARTH